MKWWLAAVLLTQASPGTVTLWERIQLVAIQHNKPCPTQEALLIGGNVAQLVFFEWTLFTCEPWLVSEMFQKPFKSMRLFIYATIFINSRRKAPDVNISPNKLFHCKSHVYWRCIWIQCFNTALVNTVAMVSSTIKTFFVYFFCEKNCHVKFELFLGEACVRLMLSLGGDRCRWLLV